MIIFTTLSCEDFGVMRMKCQVWTNLKYNLVGQLLIATPKLKFGLILPNIYSTVALPLVCLLDLNSLVLLIQ